MHTHHISQIHFIYNFYRYTMLQNVYINGKEWRFHTLLYSESLLNSSNVDLSAAFAINIFRFKYLLYSHRSNGIKSLFEIDETIWFFLIGMHHAPSYWNIQQNMRVSASYVKFVCSKIFVTSIVQNTYKYCVFRSLMGNSVYFLKHYAKHILHTNQTQ